MANDILTLEQEKALLAPIDKYVGDIQKKIDDLRRDGTDVVVSSQNKIDSLKRDRSFTKEEKAHEIDALNKKISAAKEVENKNKAEIDKLISDAKAYLKEHYKSDYYDKVVASCAAEKVAAKEKYDKTLVDLKSAHEKSLSQISDSKEVKDEKYVYKNKLSNAKIDFDKDLQTIKDKRHEAYTHEYHLIDLLCLSKFSFSESWAQRKENYKYTFNKREFFLKNGLYIAILVVFIGLCILTPIIKGTPLLTPNNILNILTQASPRMFLALGVAGLILLTGTDLSIGRLVGMSMIVCTCVMHQGPNTGTIFGAVVNFDMLPLPLRILLALVISVALCTLFTTIAGFFTAKFKMHPFISTMANMLVVFGLVTYATKGVSFGAIEPAVKTMIIPEIPLGGFSFPTIILWALAAIAVVWFIWNKTRFGKNLYAVGGNPEAASVSGISVIGVTVGAFVLAGILYGFGSWLECARMTGSGSAAYGQGWEMDAIAAAVVGGVSFTGGIGKISGVVTGVCIFTALTYSLTILGIDTNLQFVFSGLIILIAVTLDCLKYVQKK